MNISSVSIKLLLVMCFWGSAFVSGRMLAQSHPPIVIAFYRFFIATVFLFPMLYAKNRKIFASNKINYLKFAILGLFGVTLYNIFFLNGLKTIEAGRASLIIALNPVLSTICSFLFFKESLKRWQVLGVITGLLGTLVILARGNPLELLSPENNIGQGEVYLVLAVFSWITYTLLGKIYLQTISSFEAITWACFFGLLLLTPMALSYDIRSSLTALTQIDIFNILNLGIFSTLLGFSWYYDGVRELGVSKTTSFLNFLPLVGVICGIIFLGEEITAPLFVGGALIISGVYLVNKKYSQKS